MNRRNLKNIEWGILICTILLFLIGCIALYSATEGTEHAELIKQLQWFAICVPVVIVLTIIDYKTIIKLSPIFYGIFILLLIVVLFTEPINGATSWFDLKFFAFQPAEFAKIFVICFMAYVMNIYNKNGKEEINKPLKLLSLLLIVGVPVLLIIKQPDYGTAFAFIVSVVFMLFAGGIKKRYIITAFLLVVILVPIAYMYILPEHAKTRIDIYLNPDLDPRGAGYNIIQSKLAIGAGQFFGMGLLKGNQTQLGFLYPKTTDFIYSVIGEEMGFIVAGAIIILYVILITKIIYVAKTAKDNIGSYTAIGIAGVFVFYMVENIGMTMGLLPITGVPLPFVSYGGSALLTNFVLIALILNISGRRQKAIFIE